MLAIGVAGCLVVQPVNTEPAAAAATTATGDDSPAKQAKASGQRVEVLEKRRETAQTFANPDGTFTLEQTNIPVRTKQGDQWVDINTTLEHSADGRVRPKATALDVSFSGGGTDPLIVMKSDGYELKLSWPGALPEPTVADDNVTYPNVFPDVDLKITASAESYSEVLVVKTPEAARLPELQGLDLEMEAADLTVAKTPGGAIEAKDDLGKVVFTGPQPVMWDSRGEAQAPTDEDRTEAPLEGDKVVQIPVSVTQDSLSISPAASLVNDAGTEYPLHIDPPFSSAQNGRAMINEHFPTTSSWNWAGPEGVGYQAFEPWSRKRLIYKMGISGLAGTHITAAVFSAYETWAASCTKKEVQVWKTAAISTAVNWSNGSGSNVWLKKLASVTDAVGRDECTPNGKWLEFNVLTAVAEQAAARSSWVHLGLRAASETDSMAWKRFHAAVKLSITYNNVPVVSGPHTTDPASGCAPSTAPGRINQRQPVPHIKILDSDRQPSQAGFEIWYNGDSAPRWRGTSLTMVSSSTLVYSPQAAVSLLDENRLVGWRVRAWDGVDYSAWSPMCWLFVDTTEPPFPTVTVTSGDPNTTIFPLGQPISVRLTTSRSDPNYFRYTIDSEEPTSPNIPISPGTFSFTPTRPGPLVIRAWSYDRAGNRSVGYGQAVVKVEAGPPTGRWYMDEGQGTVVGDSSGKGRNLNLGAAAWEPGDRWNTEVTEPNDWSVKLPGDASITSAASNLVDTSRSFSVSARVRVAAKPGRQVAVSEDRPGAGGFMLGVLSQDLSNPFEPQAVWAVSIPDPDGTGQITAAAPATGYFPGEWIYLSAVYDSVSRDLVLFVNHIPVAAVAVPGTAPVADGTGPLRVGAALDGGLQTHFVEGQVDDVRIYPGQIDENTVYVDDLDSTP